MDTPALPIGYFNDGARYLEDVEKLGLRPAAFFWAYDRLIEMFVLVLITEEFDAVGPLVLSKLLFKAYNAAATPSSIDPFIVRLHSPDHRIVREMDKIMPFNFTFTSTNPVSPSSDEKLKIGRAVANFGGLEIDGDWIYRFNKPLTATKKVDLLRRWHRFERNVDAIAA
jgi:hypothetical protein